MTFVEKIWRWLLFKVFRNLQVERTGKVIMVTPAIIVGVFLFPYLGFCKCLEY